MEEFVKVVIYRGDENLETTEIDRDEFERALDELFCSDEADNISLVVDGAEFTGITDLILESGEDENPSLQTDESLILAA